MLYLLGFTANWLAKTGKLFNYHSLRRARLFIDPYSQTNYLYFLLPLLHLRGGLVSYDLQIPAKAFSALVNLFTTMFVRVTLRLHFE